MPSRISLPRALLLASAVAAPAAAQPGSAPGATQPGSAEAVRVLLDQATFWRGQYQPQKVEEALTRALALDPQNADALAMQAQGALDAGDMDLAQKSLRQLKLARPGDPRVPAIEQALLAGPPDMAAVEEARRLARDNRPNEAAATFRRAFRGDTPPPALATEYYQMLAGTDDGWAPARAGLAAVIRANPDDLPAQLAYAELLTYRDDTRGQGLTRLDTLTAYPAIAREADVSYRRALFWLPSGPDSVPRFDAYLARHPSDAEIASRGTAAKNDPNAARAAGFDAMQAGNTGEAEARFIRALAADPDDENSLVGLALVRFKQHREADGRALIHHVIDIDPGRKDEFGNMLAPAPEASRGRVNDGGGGERIRQQYRQVAAQTQRGDYVAAETLLRRLMGSRPNAGNYVQLGSIQASAGRADDAARSYRQALALQPRNPQALAGLGRLMVQAGHLTEAEALFAQAGSRAGSADITRLRGEAYRAQADNATDPGQRTALLRDAVAADPADPWLRLELARMLLSQGRAADGQAAMAAVTASRRATVQQLRAGIYYANEAQDLPEAASLIARLPEHDRDADLRQIQARAAVAVDLRDAHAQGSPDAVRRRLFGLATQPDPTGVRVAAFAQDLLKHGDKPGARELVRLALASRPATPEQRIAYANVLVGADYPGDAKLVAGRLRGVRLNPLQATTLNAVSDTIAASSADALNGHGHADAAYGELAPRLAGNPDSPELNMALARVYEAQQEPRRALALDEAILRRNPSSLEVRRSAVAAAVAAGSLGRAGEIARETTTMFPDEPQAWIMAADVARARGDNGQALQNLRTARTLRREQLKSQSSAVDAAALMAAAERASWQRYAQYLPADVASDVPPSALLPIEAPEPVTREYVQYAPPTYAPSFVRPQAAEPLSAPPSLGQRAPRPRALQPQPGVTAEYAPAEAAPFVAAFNAAPSPTLDEPSGAPGMLSQPRGVAGQQLPADAMLRNIDTSIAQVSASVAPTLNGSLSLRGRSGASGLGQLFELAAPLEATYSPGGYGRLKVQVTPTYLISGNVGGADRPQFGTNPLAANGGILRTRNQQAGGIGLDVGYAYRDVSADVGATPFGFQQQNIVGGVEYAPRFGDRLTLRVVADRRAVTDSLLSYAGAKDPSSDVKWGGVTRNRGHVQVEGGVGTVNYYAGAGGGVLLGTRVASNTEVDAGAGFSVPVYTDATKQVRLGLDLVYFGFDKNLGGFTIGQGGYFSPQQFFAALFPVNFRHQVTPDLVYNVGGSIGIQTFRQQSSNVFPNDPALQSALDALAATQFGLNTAIPGSHITGPAGGAHGDVDYRLNDNLHIGAQAGFDRAGNFTEGTGLIYARYVLAPPQPTE